MFVAWMNGYVGKKFSTNSSSYTNIRKNKNFKGYFVTFFKLVILFRKDKTV